jgi:SAM-dependent methyltransferase
MVQRKLRSNKQKIIDFITFPVRSLLIYEEDRWGLSSLRSERFDYCARYVQGYCLDVGCGRNNVFIRSVLCGNGKGIDVFPYEGLTNEEVVENLCKFPFSDGSFQSVSFIANLNHIPRPLRDIELAEAYRVLKPGGNVIVTMGNSVTEFLVHKLVWLYDKLFKTTFDMDGERGMEEEEEYSLKPAEIFTRLKQAGFKNINRHKFATQCKGKR